MAFSLIGAQPITGQTSTAVNAFGKRLADYKRWREELAGTIADYQAWIEAEGLGSGEDDLRVYELVDALESDKLTVALAGEFSRGKTELINAIFFADLKQRLLPTDIGRTTMCPTELRYDEGEPPCVRLLPIDTRQSSLTLAEYKRKSEAWRVCPLDLGQPKAMAAALAQIAHTRLVSERDAQALGLHDPRARRASRPADGKIQIPVWRHAIINFPHPLLKQGLVVLDTPGLNALGAEPELTLGLLSSAHAVLFVLAADVGVSRSDLEVWNNHVCVAKHGPREARLVVLNKADALWDELQTPEAIAAAVGHQVDVVAHILGISRRQVFAASAQKGLLGKIKADHGLVARSGLAALEHKLSADVLGAKQELMRAHITREIGSIIERARAMIEARLGSVETQLAELNGLCGENQDAIHQMIERMRAQKLAYDRTLARFQASRAVLSEQIRVLLDYLRVERIDALMAQTRAAMKDSWTTHGLQAAMKGLFDGAGAGIEKAEAQSQHVIELARALYAEFHAQHGLAEIKPAAFSLTIFRDQLRRVQEEAESFRRSPLMVMTEQHFVIKKFFITLGSRARLVYQQAGAAAQEWSKALLAPFLTQLREHKTMMDQRLDNLNRVYENLNELGGRIAELERGKQNLENQLTVIDNILRKVDRQ